MPEDDSKALGKQVAKAMVFGVLDVSPRLDTFSAWLMGIATGFLVILFANIERAISVIKIGPAKAIIVFLTISTVAGLVQKYLSLVVQIRTHVELTADLKMAEIAQAYSGKKIANPAQYFGQHADIVHMLVLFISAFPKWYQKRLNKMIFDSKADLSDLRKYTRYFFWQSSAIAFQLFCAFVTVGIILFNL